MIRPRPPPPAHPHGSFRALHPARHADSQATLRESRPASSPPALLEPSRSTSRHASESPPCIGEPCVPRHSLSVSSALCHDGYYHLGPDQSASQAVAFVRRR